MEIKYTQLLNAIRGVEDDKNVPENIVLEALTEAVAKAFKKDSELQDIEVKAEINKKSKTIDIYQYYNVVEEVEDDELEISLEDAKKQITDTEDAIKNVLGKSTKLMRPPYGAISDDIRNSLDLSFIMWNVDSLDWKSKNEAAILTEVQRQTTDGSIILMHDIHQTSVNSLPKVIEYLQGQGYSFVTVSELLGNHVKPHEIYYSRNQ